MQMKSRNVLKSAGVGAMAAAVAWGMVVASPAHAEGSSVLEKVTSRIVAVSVIDEALPSDDFEWAPVNGQTGTMVALMIDTSKAGVNIVGVDGMDSTLKTMTDSTGRDLTADPPNKDENSWSSGGIGGFPKMSKDNTLAVIDIQGQRSPAAGAKSMKLSATLAVQVAKGQKKAKSDVVALEAGPLKVADHSLKINEVKIEEGYDGEKTLSVTLELTGDDANHLAEVVFYDANGKVIESNNAMSMQFGDTLQKGVTLKPATLKQASIELVFWDGFEVLQLPVDLEVPVAGL